MIKRPKYFLPYLIIGENGWERLRDDAPEEAKQEFKEYLENKKFAEENDIDF